jgi:ABC-type glycerol-3-phosphate transport system substrate-binding protein
LLEDLLQESTTGGEAKMRKGLIKFAVAGLVAALTLAPLSQGAAAPSAVVLDFPSWMWAEPGVGEYFTDAITEFERENPHIRIKKTTIPAAEWEDKMIITLAAGQAPDILKLFTHMVPFYMDRGLLEPLNRWLDATDFAKRLAAVQKVATHKGKVYGVVLTASPQGLVYNKRLLDTAGARIPTTPAEMLEAARAVKAKTGLFGYGYPNDPADVLLTYIVLMQWGIGFGGDFAKGGKPTCNDPKIVEGLEWLKRFLDADLVPRGMRASTLRRMFWEGQIAMLIDGPWTLTYVRDRNPSLYPSTGLAAPPMPLREGGAITGGAFYTIPRAAKYKEEAWKFIEFINREKWQRRWLEELVQMPAQVLKPSEKFVRENPWSTVMMELAAKQKSGFGYAPPGFEKYGPEFRQIVVNHWAQVLAGRQTVKVAMDACQSELDKWAATLIR